MLNEIFKDCKYYEELYEVSNYGRVRNKKTKKFLTQHDNGNGYLFVCLWVNNKSKREYVHRLVALTFIPNPDNKPTVNHKDEDKQNNYVENLEWMTYKENNNYRTHIERSVSTMKEKGHYNKYSERMKNNNPNHGQWTYGDNAYARKVICDGIVFDSIKACAEYYGVNYGTFRGYMCDDSRKPQYFKDKGLSYYKN